MAAAAPAEGSPQPEIPAVARDATLNNLNDLSSMVLDTLICTLQSCLRLVRWS